MEKTIITWNIPNWITIFLMAALGYLVVATLTQIAWPVSKGSSTTSKNSALGGPANG